MDRTDRQIDRRTDNGPIGQGEPFYKRSPKNRWTFSVGLQILQKLFSKSCQKQSWLQMERTFGVIERAFEIWTEQNVPPSNAAVGRRLQM